MSGVYKYYPFNGSAPVSPAYSSYWTGVGTSPSRSKLIPSTNTTDNRTHSGAGRAGNPKDVPEVTEYITQHIITVPETGPLIGSFRMAVASNCAGGTGTNPVLRQLRAIVRIMSSDGLTERGRIFEGSSGLVSNSANEVRTISGNLIPGTVAQAGDIMVIETGGWVPQHSVNFVDVTIGTVNTSPSGAASITAPDLPFVDGTPTASGSANAWYELTLVAPASPPTNLEATPDLTSIELNWDNPVAGSAAPTSYIVSVDGAAPVDVGLVNSYLVTDLDPATEYDFEVWTKSGTQTSTLSATVTSTTKELLPPASVVAVPTIDSIALTWEPPPPESASPTGYEIVLNGGAPIVVGPLTAHEITGLTPMTEFTIGIKSLSGEIQSAPFSVQAVTETPEIRMTWDAADERYYHHGIDRGTLYIPGKDPVPWNGLTGLDEAGGASKTILYRDGQIYMADAEPGDFEASVTAWFFPNEFSECLGIPEVATGFYADNQKPKRAGLSYRSLIGSGTAGDKFGYQIHLVYNGVFTLGNRSRKTRMDKIELMEFQFDLVATPVKLPGIRSTAHYIIDTRNLSSETLTALEAILYGFANTPGRLPDPSELYEIMSFGSKIVITDLGDGTWTAEGSYVNIYMTGEGTWEINNVTGEDLGNGTYEIESTP